MAKRYTALKAERIVSEKQETILKAAEYIQKSDGEVVMYSDHIAEITALKARIAELEASKETRYPWHEAPEWAMWAATDANGKAWWYSEKPEILRATSPRHWGLTHPDWHLLKIGYFPELAKDWRNSLEKRPGT